MQSCQTNRQTRVDALLADYAAGALRSPMSVLVEAHLELSPGNQRFVHDLDALGGILLDQAPTVALKDRDRRLAAILADDHRRPPRCDRGARCRPTRCFRRRSGGSSAVRFPRCAGRPGCPACKEFRLDQRRRRGQPDVAARRPRRCPSHTHTGREAVLVLKGGFSDLTGRYDRGGLAVADEVGRPPAGGGRRRGLHLLRRPGGPPQADRPASDASSSA